VSRRYSSAMFSCSLNKGITTLSCTAAEDRSGTVTPLIHHAAIEEDPDAPTISTTFDLLAAWRQFHLPHSDDFNLVALTTTD